MDIGWSQLRVIHPPGTSGGGGPGGAGSLVVGPNYGDTNKPGIGVSADLPAIGFSGGPTVGVQAQFPATAFSGGSSVGVSTAGTYLGAPLYQTTSTNVTGGSQASSITVNKPTGTVEGDLLVALLGGTTLVGTTSFDTLSGWTEIRLDQQGAMGGHSFYKVAGASEPTSYTFNVSGGATREITAEIHRINAIDTTTPINAHNGVSNAAAPLDPDPENVSVTTTTDNCLVLAWLLHDHSALSQTHTPPANHIEVTDFEATTILTNLLGSTTDWRVFSATGATGTVVHNCTETVGTAEVMQRIAIAPGPLVLQ